MPEENTPNISSDLIKIKNNVFGNDSELPNLGKINYALQRQYFFNC